MVWLKIRKFVWKIGEGWEWTGVILEELEGDGLQKGFDERF